MFWHHFYYHMKVVLKSKEDIFWTLAFPIILGTLFAASFGQYLKNDTSIALHIPVAYIETEQANPMYVQVLDAMNGDDGLLDMQTMELAEAEQALKKGTIEGIIINGEGEHGINLKIWENGFNQTVLKSMLDIFVQYETVFSDVLSQPGGVFHLQELLDTIMDDEVFNTEADLESSKTNGLVYYYYALLAMACLYGGFTGLKCAMQLQANQTALAARRSASAGHRLSMLAADYLGTIVVQFGIICVFYVYMQVLGTDWGIPMPYMLLTGFLGIVVGVGNGLFIGSMGRASESIKGGVLICVTMLLCFLGGLMVYGTQYWIAEKLPWFNWINPATLIADSFYALTIYGDKTLYFAKCLVLLIMGLALCFGSYLFMRKERYDTL